MLTTAILQNNSYAPDTSDLFQTPDGYPIDVLFCETVLVQPSKFRPMRYLAGEKFEHTITANFRKLIEADQLLTIIRVSMGATRGGNLAAKVWGFGIHNYIVVQNMHGNIRNGLLLGAYRAKSLWKNHE